MKTVHELFCAAGVRKCEDPGREIPRGLPSPPDASMCGPALRDVPAGRRPTVPVGNGEASVAARAGQLGCDAYGTLPRAQNRLVASSKPVYIPSFAYYLCHLRGATTATIGRAAILHPSIPVCWAAYTPSSKRRA